MPKVNPAMPYYISPPPQNSFSRIIAGIVTLLAIIGAVMLGMVALLVVVGVALVVGCALWLRVAWIRYRLRKSGTSTDAKTTSTAHGTSKVSGQVIEAEYTVISKREE